MKNAPLTRVESLAAEASKPHRASLSAHILLQLELAAVAQWVADQDESIDADRVVEVARQAVASIRARYA